MNLPSSARAIVSSWLTGRRPSSGCGRRPASSTGVRTASGRPCRPCATWSSCTTPGSVAAAWAPPTSSRRWASPSTSSRTRRSRGSTGLRRRPWPRSWPCGTPRRPSSRPGSTRSRPRPSRSRRRCPTGGAGRPTPPAGQWGSASARFSTRSGRTTRSAFATWRSWSLLRLGRVDRVSEMTSRPLGDSGLLVSAVGIGCNAFGRRVDLDGVREILDAAQDVGITLLDTADVYGGQGASEQMLGEALQGRRDEFVVATKFGMDMQGANGPDRGARGSRAYVRRAVESSLRRLHTDYLDLYQYHEPDGVTPFEETLSVLSDLVHEGKVRYLGVSNVAGWQVADADWTARASGFERFISVQNRYSLLDRTVEAEVVPACEEYGLGLLPYFPLEYGLLTGKYRRGEAAPAGSRAAAAAS